MRMEKGHQVASWLTAEQEQDARLEMQSIMINRVYVQSLPIVRLVQRCSMLSFVPSKPPIYTTAKALQ